ncbi:putative F-box domain-containing protein [Arabidopsis thaliana]
MTRETRMISDLPEDLIEEILYRVPVASLRSLRATCKRWYHQALFKDPRFIKKYNDN